MNLLNLLIAIAIFLSACGKEEKECEKGTACDIEHFTPFIIKGSVSGAFAVTVDDKDYDDIESFYSQELKSLSAKLEKAGYVGYEIDLQAELGFKDLTNEMNVFVAPMENRGYAAKTKVGYDNTFKFKMPAEAAGDIYQFRAVKRIALVLKKENEELTFCYNFSALETEIEYSKADLPVVLSRFETQITDYDCDSAKEKEDGLEIPANQKLGD